MNKQEFVSAMATKTGLSKKSSGDALEAVIAIIMQELKKGGRISLIGFGTFDVLKRAARTGRNPRTGEAMKISASKSPRFKAGRGLKEAVK